MDNKNRFLLLPLIFALLAAPCFSQLLFNGEPSVRVRILKTVAAIHLTPNGDWQIKTDDGFSNIAAGTPLSISAQDGLLLLENEEGLINTFGDSLVFRAKTDSSTLLIKEVPYGVGWWWEGKEDRIYEGVIAFYAAGTDSVEAVVKLPLEQYLLGVVPYEIGGDSPLEALKAQAVAARSEAVMALRSGLYSGPHHDLTSDVECQVFSGNHKRTAASDRAVRETSRLILWENDTPIHAYYASNCGGHSELIQNVWPERPRPQSYQLALIDDSTRHAPDLSSESAAREWIDSSPAVFCNPAGHPGLPPWSRKNFRWQRAYLFEELTSMIDTTGARGMLSGIKALERGPSGRIYRAHFIFEKDSIEVKGELSIRMMWKPALRSANFYVQKTDSGFVLKGAGWGHGVGMCQSGAVAQALQGKDFKAILKHYYPAAEAGPAYFRGVR